MRCPAQPTIRSILGGIALLVILILAFLNFNLKSEFGDPVQVSLIGRGMAIYDTPLARGRPLAGFEIVYPGIYTMAYPGRPVTIYILPDYLSGSEGRITFIVCLEIGMLLLAAWFFIRRRRATTIQIPFF